MKIERITNGPKNHLFGFHDICAWNRSNDRLVALEVDAINIPPSSKIAYGLGYVSNNKEFIRFGDTRAFNYPQGARQQWIAKTNNVIVNDVLNRKVVSKIYDTDLCKQIDVLAYATHIISEDGWAFGLDYARLFRLGAYGYSGAVDSTLGDDAPKDSGIVKHHILTKEKSVFLSVFEMANFEMGFKQGKNHYITHLVFSPNQQRIAFLHRYKLKDGGEVTRLCTIDVNGENLRCLLTGFYSHFDWMNDDHIMIWRRHDDSVLKLRSSLLYKIVPQQLLFIGKKFYRTIKNVSKPKKVSSPEKIDTTLTWLKVADSADTKRTPIGGGIIFEDGHPMFCPTNRDWFISDNYPNKEGIRTLYLYNIKENKKIDLGQFKMLDEKPDLAASKEILKDTDSAVLQAVSLEDLAFTRSGLHCDLHPRWSPDGKKVSFDSIHEGSRQVYMVNVEKFLK